MQKDLKDHSPAQAPNKAMANDHRHLLLVNTCQIQMQYQRNHLQAIREKHRSDSSPSFSVAFSFCPYADH